MLATVLLDSESKAIERKSLLRTKYSRQLSPVSAMNLRRMDRSDSAT